MNRLSFLNHSVQYIQELFQFLKIIILLLISHTGKILVHK